MENAVFISFQKLGYHASRNWFDQCFEWCRQENPNFQRQQLLKEIEKQWFMADIREDGVQDRGQIHESWSSQSKCVIRQNICLQVLSATDIARPAYAQLQDLLKVDNENATVSADDNNAQQFKASWEPKGSRVLRFTFHDGFKQIQGIEHEPLSFIKYPVNPGMKVQLIAPLICRRGVILLTPKNVKILCGNGIEELEQEFDVRKMLTAQIGTDNVGPILPLNNQVPQPSSNASRQPLSEQPQRQPSSLQPQRRNTFEDDDDDFFKDVELPDELPQEEPPSQRQKLEEKPPSPKCINQAKPFEYLKNFQDSDKDRVFVIKGCIVTLASKLSVSDKVWKLSVIVTDGTASRQMDICPQLLIKWIGIYPPEYAELAKMDKENVKANVQKVSKKLSTFNGLIKLQKDKVIDLVPFNRGHLQQLKNRLKN